MKLWRILIVPLLMSCAHSFAEAPTINLSATWNWPPRSYYDSPDRAGRNSLWRQLQHAGILTPIDERDGFRPYFPYGYYGYDLMWRYDYSVQLKPQDRFYFYDIPEVSFPVLPGAAPLEPRDSQQEDSWDAAITNFLSALDPSGWPHNQTNVLDAKKEKRLFKQEEKP